MGRTESRQVAQQGMAQSQQDQANAAADRARTQKSLGNYSRNIDSFMNMAARSTARTASLLKHRTYSPIPRRLQGKRASRAILLRTLHGLARILQATLIP
jgi:hypothetical protein